MIAPKSQVDGLTNEPGKMPGSFRLYNFCLVDLFNQ